MLDSTYPNIFSTTERAESLARALGRAHNLYSRWFNSRRSRSGHLWQNRFYSAPLDREHLVTALRYVDLNPVRARLVERALDYPWSSAEAHARSRDPSGVLDMQAWVKLSRFDDWARLLKAATPEEELLQRIRDATRSGKPLGKGRFLNSLERQVGQPLAVRPRGRPRIERAAAAGGAKN